MAKSMPNDWDYQEQEIDQRRKYAEALRSQGMQPLEQSAVGGQLAPIHWTQGLAKMLQAYTGAKELESVKKERQDMAQRRQTALADTFANYTKASQGSSAEMAPSMARMPNPDGSMQQVETRPAVAPNRGAALAELMKNSDTAPYALQAQMAELGKGPMVVGRSLVDPASGKVIATDSTWQSEQQAAREAKKSELEARLADARLSREDRAALQRELISARRDMADATRSAGREKAPAGYRFSTDGTLSPIPGGPADPRTKTGPDGMPKLTEAQGKANLYQSRATESDKIMSDLEGQYSPLAINAKQGVGKMWAVGGPLETAANAMLPANAQKAEQAQRNFVNAILRQESGAVIADTEFANAQKQYFPQPGDRKEVIAQKKKNRETAIAGLKVMAGPAAKSGGASGEWKDL